MPSRLDPEEDRRLVERCLDGDARAWEALVHRHERLVYAVARSWRLSDEDLGDVFQEVFAALVKGLPRMRDARTLVRWLASTTERVARAAALRSRRAQALAPATDPHVLREVASGDPEVGADLERLERQALVRLAMAAIGGRCRELLSALYYEDPTPAYAELSARLGVPVGSLGPTRARCFQKLREALGRLAADEPEDGGISEAADPTSGPGGSNREPRRGAPGESRPGARRMGDPS
jgi:RNA polymerase sigma factor (sigma-70 family)